MGIRKYIEELYKDEPETIEEIVRCGCAAGFSPFIYYYDTVKFYDRFEKEIWDLILEAAQNNFSETLIEFLSDLAGSKNVGSLEQFKNLLCWFAVEQVCLEIQADREAANETARG